MKSMFTPQKPSLIKRWKEKRKAFLRREGFISKHAINFLNIAQFLGAVNDNIFKFLTLFLLIDLKGVEHSSEILFWVGTVYVLPFLLFSSAAGILADKISKQKLIVALKGLEVVITALGVLAFAFKSPWACYTLLFLLSFQSAAFGPPKYSIIPEIVKIDKISKANGFITSFTYLAIIVGTFLASFCTQVTGKNFILSAALCVVIAIIGFGASLFLPFTEPNRTTKKIKAFFLKEIYETLVFCYKTPHLLLSVLSAGFFLYIGAYFQLNIIPYAMEALNLSEVSGGYLFLAVAIGIAGGAIWAGKLSKHQVELGLSCLASLVLGALLLALFLLPKTIILNVILFILVGVVGGLFIVPFESYIQTYSPDKKRGQIVAASNFVSFSGVLLAPISLYLFSGVWKLHASTGFCLTSVVTFIVGIALCVKLFPVALNYFAKKCLRPFVHMQPLPSAEAPVKVLYAQKFSFKALLTLGFSTTHMKLVVLPYSKSTFYRILLLFRIAKKIRSPIDLSAFLDKTLEKEAYPCLLCDHRKPTLEYDEIISAYKAKRVEFKQTLLASHKQHWALDLKPY